VGQDNLPERQSGPHRGTSTTADFQEASDTFLDNAEARDFGTMSNEVIEASREV